LDIFIQIASASPQHTVPNNSPRHQAANIMIRTDGLVKVLILGSQNTLSWLKAALPVSLLETAPGTGWYCCLYVTGTGSRLTH
jgi:hypothetical protein